MPPLAPPRLPQRGCPLGGGLGGEGLLPPGSIDVLLAVLNLWFGAPAPLCY